MLRIIKGAFHDALTFCGAFPEYEINISFSGIIIKNRVVAIMTTG